MQLNTQAVWKPLPNGELVVYNPNGSAKPFVLSGIALQVFHTLLQNYTSEELAEWAQLQNIPQKHLEKVLQHLATEKLFDYPHEPTKTRSQKPSVKKVGFWVHVTDRCNLACDYCYAAKGTQTMSEATIHNVIDILAEEIAPHRIQQIELKFAGGEPLLAFPTVVRMLEYAQDRLSALEKGVRPSIITNATLVSPSIAQTLKDTSFRVMVSLDGLGEFNGARKYPNDKPSFPEVLQGIEVLQEAGITPTILTTISNTNIEGLSKLLPFVAEKGLSISLSLSRDYDPHRGLELDLNLLNTLLLPQLEDWVTWDNRNLPNIHWNGMSFKGKQQRICGAGRTYFGITPTGGISTCQMTLDNPVVVKATTHTGIIWLGEGYEVPTKDAKCSKCTWRYVCCAGCEVLAQQAGTLEQPSVYCETMERMLPLVLKLEGRRIQIRREQRCRTQL